MYGLDKTATRLLGFEKMFTGKLYRKSTRLCSEFLVLLTEIYFNFSIYKQDGSVRPMKQLIKLTCPYGDDPWKNTMHVFIQIQRTQNF